MVIAIVLLFVVIGIIGYFIEREEANKDTLAAHKAEIQSVERERKESEMHRNTENEVTVGMQDVITENAEVTGSQSNISWRLSNHIIEFYGTGEFRLRDILYSSDLQFADILLPGPMVDIDDYCAPWCYDKEKDSLRDNTEIHTIRFQPGFTVIRYDFCREAPSLDGFCGGRYTGCAKLHDVYIPASVTNIEKKAFYEANSDLVIHAPEGSFAEQWAKENGYQFEPTT